MFAWLKIHDLNPCNGDRKFYNKWSSNLIVDLAELWGRTVFFSIFPIINQETQKRLEVVDIKS